MGFSKEDINEFYQEAKELLEAAEESLLSLDQGGAFQANYDSIFRAFHSVKGGAGMMELNALQAHMHELENLLVQSKASGKIPKNHIDLFLRGIDACKEIMAGKTVKFDYKVSGSPAPAATNNKVINMPKRPKQEKLGEIVVVDDEGDIVEILKDLLTSVGFNVCGFTKPKEALKYIQTNSVDMLFTDYNMPEMTGLELSSEVGKKHPELPIIIVSGHIKGSVVLSGIYAIIEKPFNEPFITQSAIHATKRYQMNRLLNRAIDLLMYQFSDLDEFLKAQGKDQVRNTLRNEINSIVELRGKLRSLNKKEAA